MKPVFIIAEAGVNHNGSVSKAMEMVSVAKACGADAIKFQVFNPRSLVSRYAPKAEYQKNHTPRSESQLEMLQKLSLDTVALQRLTACCRKTGIRFLSSPFDLESISFLEKLRVAMIKIPSGEITNLPYLEKIGRMNRRLFLSTGMATMKEVENAVSILVRSGTDQSKITLLHCTTEYPAPFSEINLRVIAAMRCAFKLQVGYSDHTPGIEVAIAAAALGATVIEKHFTLDRNLTGPDHRASLEPSELKALVAAVRNIETAMGSSVKKPVGRELKNRDIVRKSIVASCSIKAGDIFSPDNITVKRPGTGISPMKWYNVLGKRAVRAFSPDEMIEL